jgi:CubicO group peptidase (beta-lactamase class C family)
LTVTAPYRRTQACGEEIMSKGVEGNSEAVSSGEVAPGNEAVRHRFDRVLAERAGCSGAVCVFLNGRPIVDLWGGPRFARDSLVPLWSCTKGAAALVAALALQRGLLDADEVVARYWPEFAVEDKSSVTVAQLLSHQAGLISVDGGISFDELAGEGDLAGRLAQQRPYWYPGSDHGYHALTFGVLVAELVRRATGTDLQELYETEIRSPIEADFYMGLPESEEPRVVTCRAHPIRTMSGDSPENPHWRPEALATATEVHHLPEAHDFGWVQDRRIRAFGAPSVGGVGNARGLARVYAACVTGLDGRPPLLASSTVERVRTPLADGWELCLPNRTRFGLGFVLDSSHLPMAGPGSFGHDGANGSIGFACPDRRLAFGFVSDHAPPPPGTDPVVNELIAALV